MGKLFPAFLLKKRDRSSRFLLLLLPSRQICNGLYRDRASARNQLCNQGQIRGSDQICTPVTRCARTGQALHIAEPLGVILPN